MITKGVKVFRKDQGMQAGGYAGAADYDGFDVDAYAVLEDGRRIDIKKLLDTHHVVCYVVRVQ